ncbi:MAG TPA: T9SS type A sorting domain-containing protein, partial [Panacibacter sp.]|nr:T9SS type A sorting domain-containing protein [Panacibacter sp.]
MKKIYLLIMSLSAFVFLSNAQTQLKTATPVKMLKPAQLLNRLQPGNTTGDCDTTNLNTAINDWSAYYYTYGANGYIFGSLNFDGYSFQQTANFYDLSSTAYTYLTGCLLNLAFANSNVAANNNKKLIFRVLEDNGGTPGSEIGSTAVYLKKFTADVRSESLSEVFFSAPLELPASKRFYIAVDYSTLVWNPSGPVQDSMSLVANGDDESLNYALQYISGIGWLPVNQIWSSAGGPLDISMWIFPYVSTSATGCSALPVKLLSFNADRKNSDVTLSWKISGESNMKQYEIQRADNNNNYKTVATVKSLNSLKDQSYSVTDKNAFNLSSAVQYRLKQVDGDGSASYSRVIAVKSNAVITDVTFANPFQGALKLQLNLATAQQIAVNVYDMQGKLVASEKSKTYNASANTIILNSTANLKSGLYVLKLNAG